MAGSEHEAEHAAQRRRSAFLRPRWELSLYPQAAEAGGCLVVPASGVSSGRRPDPERALSEAIRRARTKIRRYGVANRLNRLATLTYAGAGCYEPADVRRDVGEFFKVLRPSLGGEAFPYVWVPEWHPGGRGLHLPVGSGTLAEARKASGYLCKYIGKGLDDERRRAGLHRYEVAQGFQPERITMYGRTDDDAIDHASEYMGRKPERIWRSSQAEGWRAPPACWVAWPD